MGSIYTQVGRFIAGGIGTAISNAAPGTNGTGNTGGGGGGGGYNSANTASNGGNGGSGIVIIKWS
jgi:hypothetical protein